MACLTQGAVEILGKLACRVSRRSARRGRLEELATAFEAGGEVGQLGQERAGRSGLPAVAGDLLPQRPCGDEQGSHGRDRLSCRWNAACITWGHRQVVSTRRAGRQVGGQVGGWAGGRGPGVCV